MNNHPALDIGCTYCRAKPGEPCRNFKYGRPRLEHFPFHICRVKDAEEAEQEIPF